MRLSKECSSNRFVFKSMFTILALLFLFVLLPFNVNAQSQDNDTNVAVESSQTAEAQSNNNVVAGSVQETIEKKQMKTPPGLTDFLFTYKYLTIIALTIIGLILVLSRWVNVWIRVAFMAIVFILFGLDYIFPLHPALCVL